MSIGVTSMITLRPSNAAGRGRSPYPLDRAGRQMIEQVDHPREPELLERLGDLRPDALQHLDFGEQGV